MSCDHCGNKAGIYSCGGCSGGVTYCHEECQENGWKKHSAVCEGAKTHIGLAFAAGILAGTLLLTPALYGGYRWYYYNGYYYPRGWFLGKYGSYLKIGQIPPQFVNHGKTRKEMKQMLKYDRKHSTQYIKIYKKSLPPLE